MQGNSQRLINPALQRLEVSDAGCSCARASLENYIGWERLRYLARGHTLTHAVTQNPGRNDESFSSQYEHACNPVNIDIL